MGNSEPPTGADGAASQQTGAALWIMFGGAGAVGIGTPAAYAASPASVLAQRRSPDTTLLFFGCAGLVILIVAILIRLFHQRFAPRYTRQLLSTCSIDEVLIIIGELFPPMISSASRGSRSDRPPTRTGWSCRRIHCHTVRAA